jgi:hypothetical protein
MARHANWFGTTGSGSQLLSTSVTREPVTERIVACSGLHHPQCQSCFESMLGRVRCLVEPLRFPGSQDVTPRRWAGVGGALCIPDAQSVNPGLILSPTTVAASCTRVRRRITQQAEANAIHPHYARSRGPGVGSSLSGFPGRRAHLNCGHIIAGTGVSARASATPKLSTTAPRSGPAAYVRDPRATVTDHGCSRGPPISPRGRCTSSLTLLGPEGNWWMSVRWTRIHR